MTASQLVADDNGILAAVADAAPEYPAASGALLFVGDAEDGQSPEALICDIANWFGHRTASTVRGQVTAGRGKRPAVAHLSRSP